MRRKKRTAVVQLNQGPFPDRWNWIEKGENLLPCGKRAIAVPAPDGVDNPLKTDGSAGIFSAGRQE
jgi:hypothetical protein